MKTEAIKTNDVFYNTIYNSMSKVLENGLFKNIYDQSFNHMKPCFEFNFQMGVKKLG